MSKITPALLKICICISPLFGFIQGADYRISYQDEDIISPCDEFPNNFASNFVDMSKLNFELLDDDNVHVTGEIFFTRDLPEKPIQVSAQVYKKTRGQWINTVYNVKREDFCVSLFNRVELWYNITKNIPKEKRICPPKKDFSIDIDALAGVIVPIPDRSADGEYKIEIKMGAGTDLKDFVCFNVLVNADKI